jgi:glutamate/tyrosine decarboxylase-like PLP-dependent enzyme
MEALQTRERAKWKDGFVSGGVYHGDEEHINFLNRVYAIHSQSNPLHSDLWPSATKFEAEIVAMTAHMLGAGPENDICGTVTSGGTESILLAMKSYRDRARDQKSITTPEIIAPATAHAAFDKAAQYFDMKLVRIPVGANFRADVNATRRAITRNTIVLIGSAPSFPHGVVDPIPELSEMAGQQGIGFHTDACLGGFLLPWADSEIEGLTNRRIARLSWASLPPACTIRNCFCASCAHSTHQCADRKRQRWACMGSPRVRTRPLLGDSRRLESLNAAARCRCHGRAYSRTFPTSHI